MGDRQQFLRIKGVLPAIALILFGAVLVFSSNFLLTNRANTAVENSQAQAQTIQESGLCKDSPEEAACKQSQEILDNPTTKVTGPQGVQGFQGLEGPQGLAGKDGKDGQPGLMGLTGSKGNQGDQGGEGLQGLLGIQGGQGLQGLAGEQGLPGLTGAKGDPGDPGLDGKPGADGKPGVDGAPGATPTGITIDCATGSVTLHLSNGTSVPGTVTCPAATTPEPAVPALPDSTVLP